MADNSPVPPQPPADADRAGLAAGLAGLAGIVADRGTLDQQLTEVATFAMEAIPGADGAGLTMLDAGESDTIVASAPFVREVDAVQYRLGEGPCISAAADGETTGSPALGEDASWPAFGPRAAELNVHSALSLPLVVHGEVIGALNVYARTRDAFSGSSVAVGEQFAAPAAVAVHNARTLRQARRQTERLEAALSNRSMIDHAIGMVMARSGISADEAFVRLRLMSQHEHIKLTAVAARLVQQAVRRARAHQRDGAS